VRTKPLPPVEQCFIRGVDLRAGAFIFPRKDGDIRVIASDGTEWAEGGLPLPAFEHVSVSLANRCPTWGEMDWVKSLWWNDSETVIQYHVPKSQHINFHPYCLHLWKPIGIVIPLPPAITVGPQVCSG
jgi:hypothetical protein